jgi:hypothetical protein
MNYISLKELADKWDISIKYLQTLARTGMLEGAIKKDHRWFVPEDIRRPVDHRVRTGAYKDWRKRYNVRKFKIDEEFLRGRFRTLEDTDASGDTAQNDSNTGNAGADETSEVSSEAGFASSSDVSRNSESKKGTSSRWIF